jgi:hypothetical protein
MDNTTNATMMAQDNMTSNIGNMTDANTTQSGNMSGCGDECFRDPIIKILNVKKRA